MTDDRAVAGRVVQTGERLGAVLVFGSAFFWSFGGAISRFLHIGDSWTVVFWRGLFAALFLLAFMLVRDGPRGTVTLFRGMGLPGTAVGLCFALASTCFIVAIAHTTIANVILLGACVPLFAALMVWLLYGERIAPLTWAAIAAVMAGVAIMISGSFTGNLSPFGDALALVTAVSFATATVITRRYPGVRMTPAVCFGCFTASTIAATQASGLAVSASDLGILFVFGTFNLGLGMALFATGARHPFRARRASGHGGNHAWPGLGCGDPWRGAERPGCRRRGSHPRRAVCLSHRGIPPPAARRKRHALTFQPKTPKPIAD
jgi:drug/metabolite transporter (DMT)-like permease